MNSDQKKIIFIHIPKTAGTTFKSVLFSNYREEQLGLWTKPESNKTQEELLAFIDQEKDLIMGHIDLGRLPEKVFNEYRLLCFLRNPIDQVVSHYVNVKNSNMEEHDQFNDMPFEGFLDSYRGRNWQCQFLSSYKEKPMAINNVDTLLKEAVNNLESRIFFCGIGERFDESLIYLRAKIGLKNTAYQVRNSTMDRELSKRLKQDFKKEIEKNNEADIELYRRGLEIFNGYRKLTRFYFFHKIRHHISLIN